MACNAAAAFGAPLLVLHARVHNDICQRPHHTCCRCAFILSLVHTVVLNVGDVVLEVSALDRTALPPPRYKVDRSIRK